MSPFAAPSRRSIGTLAENQAAEFLRRAGYEILARNLSWRGGEVDLVAWKEGTLAFVEVKCRNNPRWDAVFSLDHRKRRAMVRTARWILARNQEWIDRSEEIRFDLVVIQAGKLPEHATGIFAI